jgi:MEMO1 family protein
MSLSSIFSFSSCGQSATNRQEMRQAAVAGSFYPAEKIALEDMLKEFYQNVGSDTCSNVAAVIVPHAGYVFSGEVAASAFSKIDANHHYDHIFIIGPSHHVSMRGASINNGYETYDTPIGLVKVDVDLCDSLIKGHPECFTCNPAAHSTEHCIEVQLPLLQYHFHNMPPIVPIIIGTEHPETLKKIAKALAPYFSDKNLFVISSDFSHYPSYKDAQKVDKRTADAVSTGDIEELEKAIAANERDSIPNLATSACGECGIATLLYMINGNKGIKINHVMYRNSGDSPYGDKFQVVGYNSFVVLRDGNGKPTSAVGFNLTDSEKSTLLHIARTTIANRLNRTSEAVYKESELTSTLRMNCGAFVTLNENGNLRGCIGRFGDSQPLYRVVEEMAEAAAFEDPRFNSVAKSELPKIEIEISVLSPMKRIHSIDEFTLHKQGIYISKHGMSGTFLPQVADETNWTKEEFLGHCSRDKAGLGWDGWKTAELYTYEAIVFNEK